MSYNACKAVWFMSVNAQCRSRWITSAHQRSFSEGYFEDSLLGLQSTFLYIHLRMVRPLLPTPQVPGLSSPLLLPCCRHSQASPIPWSNSSPLQQTANCGCERVLHPELSPSTLGFIASGYKSFFLLGNRMTQCPCWAEKFRRRGLAPLSATSPFNQISAGQPGTEMQSESSSSLVHGEAVWYHAKSLSAATTGPVSCLSLVF